MKKEFIINNDRVTVENLKKEMNKVSFEFNGKVYLFNLLKKIDNEIIIESENKLHHLKYKDGLARINAKQFHIDKMRIQRGKNSDEDGGNLKSPMPGKILKISVKVGSSVKKGTTLLVMEAMKMEHSLKAPCDCTIDKINFAEGEQVEGDIELVSISSMENS